MKEATTRPAGCTVSLLALAALLLAAFAVVRAPAAHAAIGENDYPSSLASAPLDSKVDPWSFYNRECTSFVAWRINNDDGVAFTNGMNGGHWGNAYQWWGNAGALGYPRNSTPTEGSIAWWDKNYDGARSAGHVAYVDSVSSTGAINVEEYNYLNAGGYDQRTVYPGTKYWPSGFIHIKDISSAGSGGGVQGMTYLGTGQLTEDMKMYPNQYLLSDDARWVLAMQGDGNLVLYGPGYTPEWSSGTAGKSVAYLLVQDDGNVVIYGTGSQGALWSTGTAGIGAPSFKVQDDGNVVVYDSTGTARWAIGAKGTTTGGAYIGTDHLDSDQWLRPNQYLKSSDGRYALYMQQDGNLVLWSPGARVLWTSGSGNHTGIAGVLEQDDGNLVIYGNGAIWATNRTATGTFRATLQNDGNLVVYNLSTGSAIWASNTSGEA
jgi:surface antigen